MNIGIEQHTGLIYEGRTGLGIGIWPTPVILQVAIFSAETERLVPPKLNELLPRSFIFREDTYNTGSRVRRGRLYRGGDTQPQDWHVLPHLVIPDERQRTPASTGTLTKSLLTFSSIRLQPYLKEARIERPVFVLGSEQGFTVWALVNVETSATGDELIALKARQNIGALPTLNRQKIIDAGGKRVFNFLEKLEIDIQSAGPESVIDRAREAATAICSCYLQHHFQAGNGEDLGRLATLLLEKDFAIAANQASTLARFHSRGKHAQQEQAAQKGRALPPIHEQDAQLAIQAVGTILRDLGWAEW